MVDPIYKKLCDTMARRGGYYPGMDIPEFYDVVQELFTLEEAAVASVMTPKPATSSAIAAEMGKHEKELFPILEAMAHKGLCSSFVSGEQRFYAGSPFVPGIFEFQFMRGTKSDRDRRLARLIHAYKAAVDKTRGPQKITFPANRVIPVGKTIPVGSQVHTYSQVTSYLDRYDPIAVSTCFCRHEAKLMNEQDDCGMPDEVCMQFGIAAQFVIERGMGRKVSKEEASETLRKAAEAGLVHMTRNAQEIDFLCNCCSCHCMILKTALHQPKPGRALFSGFQPKFDSDLCSGCQTCLDRCPAQALIFEEKIPEVDLDRCFGCGVCVAGCPAEAITMAEKPGMPDPPANRKELRAAMETPA